MVLAFAGLCYVNHLDEAPGYHGLWAQQAGEQGQRRCTRHRTERLLPQEQREFYG